MGRRTTTRTLCRVDGAASAHRKKAGSSPKAPAFFRALVSHLSRRLLWHVYAALLVLTNIWLAWLAGELLDLYISAVELWTEMAQKHLELTL